MNSRSLGFRECVLDKLIAEAVEESGGDAEAYVMLSYSHFLELVDGYRESGRVRPDTQT